MSFLNEIWDDITTGIGIITGDEDTLYPDNAKRKARVEELYNDVCNLQQELVQTKNNLEKELQSISTKYKYVMPMENFDFKSWGVAAPKTLREVIYLENIYEAFTIAGIFAIADPNNQKNFFDIVDLPFDMKLIKVGGVPILPIGGIIGGSIAGADMRSQLRQSIKELIPVRKNIKFYVMLLKEFKQQLAYLGEIETLIALGYDKEQVEVLFHKKMENIKASISVITQEFAGKMLKNLDEGRNSWTKED